MSSKEKIQVACPKCSNEQSVIIWKSVNVQLSPDAQKQVLNGELNMFQCESCNHQARIETSFLYHDMKKEFLAMYYPLVQILEQNFAEDFDVHGRLSAGLSERKSKDYDYTQDIHIVFDVAELTKYIFFREKLFEARQK